MKRRGVCRGLWGKGSTKYIVRKKTAFPLAVCLSGKEKCRISTLFHTETVTFEIALLVLPEKLLVLVKSTERTAVCLFCLLCRHGESAAQFA